jgi:hypothetical protein
MLFVETSLFTAHIAGKLELLELASGTSARRSSLGCTRLPRGNGAS